MDSRFEGLHKIIRGRSLTAQERNRQWWEALPMTYEAWESSTRGGKVDRDLLKTREKFLEANPWLVEEFDFNRYRDREVLEIGCGAGGAACHMAKLGAKILAIDLTSQATQLTRRHAQLAAVSVQVAQMDSENLALPDRVVDDVFSWGVLHHSSDTDRALGEVARVLRPGGSALIMVYNKASLRYWIKGLMWLFLRGRIFAGDNMTSVQRHFTDGFYHRHFWPGELRDVCHRTGLAVKHIAITHMSKKMLPLIPRKLDDAVKRRCGWLLVIEAMKT